MLFRLSEISWELNVRSFIDACDLYIVRKRNYYNNRDLQLFLSLYFCDINNSCRIEEYANMFHSSTRYLKIPNKRERERKKIALIRQPILSLTSSSKKTPVIRIVWWGQREQRQWESIKIILSSSTTLLCFLACLFSFVNERT